MKRGIIIDPRDNVGIVCENVLAGETVDFAGLNIKALEDIELPHKIALRDIDLGDLVVKYGGTIGYATAPIKKGAHVHVHNVDSEQMMK